MAVILQTVAGHPSYQYPWDELDRIWKLLCLNQFHDCLPGSAIGLAFKDVHKVSALFCRMYSLRCNDILPLAIAPSRNHLWSLVAPSQGPVFHYGTICKGQWKQWYKQVYLEWCISICWYGMTLGVIVFNTLPWHRTEIVTVPEKKTSWNGQQWTDEGNEYVLGTINNIATLHFRSIKQYIELQCKMYPVSVWWTSLLVPTSNLYRMLTAPKVSRDMFKAHKHA